MFIFVEKTTQNVSLHLPYSNNNMMKSVRKYHFAKLEIISSS